MTQRWIESLTRRSIDLAVARPPEENDLIGATIVNRYTIRALIGRGGMGAVYEADDNNTNERVAIKFALGLTFGDNEKKNAALLHEAWALSRCNHPNLVRARGVGECSHGTFIVMEKVDGVCVRNMIDKLGPFSVDETVNIIAQTCDALEAIHKNEILHRDVKPENMIIQTNEDAVVARLIDFGICVIDDYSEDGNITGCGEAIGTPWFMSPEQFRGEILDERTDVYSLGLTAVEMVLGRHPFEKIPGHRLALTVVGGLEGALFKPFGRRVAKVVRKATNVNRWRRYETAREFKNALLAANSPKRWWSFR